MHRLEISEPQRQQILRLANDIPAVWFSPTTTARFAKRNAVSVGQTSGPERQSTTRSGKPTLPFFGILEP